MTRQQFELKTFHLFNGLAWSVAFLLYYITDKARPEQADMFTFRIKDQLRADWDRHLISTGVSILLVLNIICIVGLISNITMSLDAKRRFSVTQLIVTLITIGFTIFYFVYLE